MRFGRDMELEPGLFLFQSRLRASEQRDLWAECRALADGPVPMYTPMVRGGRKMSVGMLCLGRHWNALSYSYEARRSDFEDLPVRRIQAPMRDIAERAAADAGYAIHRDLGIMIFSPVEGRMGVHQE